MVCKSIKQIIALQSNAVNVKSPVIVCGDIHGQFYDLLELFQVGRSLPQSKYIFIGDFVDRGYNSVQTLQLLLLLKLKYPKQLTLLRGNHESRQITTVYGFYQQIIRKYGNAGPWKFCCQIFDFLPIAAVVDGETLCIHGGISPTIKTIDMIRTIDRRMQIPHQGPFCDIMWSDPQNIETWSINTRGAGWFFGSKPVKDFCYINNLQLIARAHQLVQQGFQWWFQHNRLVTIWSAPNYCYRCNNVASIMKIQQDSSKQFFIFDTVPQSVRSTSFMNVLPYFL